VVVKIEFELEFLLGNGAGGTESCWVLVVEGALLQQKMLEIAI